MRKCFVGVTVGVADHRFENGSMSNVDPTRTDIDRTGRSWRSRLLLAHSRHLRGTCRVDRCYLPVDSSQYDTRQGLDLEYCRRLIVVSSDGPVFVVFVKVGFEAIDVSLVLVVRIVAADGRFALSGLVRLL